MRGGFLKGVFIHEYQLRIQGFRNIFQHGNLAVFETHGLLDAAVFRFDAECKINPAVVAFQISVQRRPVVEIQGNEFEKHAGKGVGITFLHRLDILHNRPPNNGFNDQLKNFLSFIQAVLQFQEIVYDVRRSFCNKVIHIIRYFVKEAAVVQRDKAVKVRPEFNYLI